MEIIKTNRFILRPFRQSDFHDIHRYASDQEVTRYMLFGPNSEEDTHAYLDYVLNNELKNPKLNYEFAIDNNHRMIGAVSLVLDKSLEQAEIGWILNRDDQRKGVMTEAASAVMQFAFQKLKVKRIFAHCDSRNSASYKLMEKLCMHYVSVEKGIVIQKRNETIIRDQLLYECFFDKIII